MRNGLGRLSIYLWLTFWLLFGLGGFGGAYMLIWVNGVSWFSVLFSVFFVGFGLGMLFMCTEYLRDIKDGNVELAGSVIRKWVKEEGWSNQGASGVNRYHQILVQGSSSEARVFGISKGIHDWLYEGDEVVVTFWPRTETVVRIDKQRSLRGSP